MMKLVTLVLGAAVVALGCSNSDQASAGGQDKNDAAMQVGDASTQTASAQPAAARMKGGSGLPDAPDWTVLDISGNTVTQAKYEGKIQIVDFWATWCGPCKMEIPHFIQLQKKYKDDLVVIGMALDTAARVIPYTKHIGLNYVNLMGDQKVARDFGVGRSIPTTYVITQDGEIFKRYVGFRPREIFEKDIQTLLARAKG